MQVGISTASFFSRMMTEESLDYIGQNGVKIAEVFLDTHSEYGEAFARLLKERMEKHGMSITAVHAMAQQFEPQLFSAGIRQRQDAWESFEKVLRSARIFGAKRYVMHGPALLKGALRNASLPRIGPIISEAADLAAQYGVMLCWENVSWAMFCYPDFVRDLQPYVKSDNLYFTLDIKQAFRSGYDPFQYIDAMGERLAHVHLCDCILDDANGLKGLALPGTGHFDFAELGRKLRETHYQGVAIIEVYSDLYQNTQEVLSCRAAMDEIMG